jgi:hypothetical protein
MRDLLSIAPLGRIRTSRSDRRPRRVLLFTLLVTAALLSGCGGDDATATTDAGTATSDSAPEVGRTSDDVCALLSDSDIRSVLGTDLPSEPNDYPDGSPYPGCSWQTGRLIVQVAPGTSVVTAPGEVCSSLDIGDEALDCPGSVEFVIGGSRVIVSTIEDVTPEQLAAIAEILATKF